VANLCFFFVCNIGYISENRKSVLLFQKKYKIGKIGGDEPKFSFIIQNLKLLK